MVEPCPGPVVLAVEHRGIFVVPRDGLGEPAVAEATFRVLAGVPVSEVAETACVSGYEAATEPEKIVVTV